MSVIFPIKVGPINTHEWLVMLESLDTWWERPKESVEIGFGLIHLIPNLDRRGVEKCDTTRHRQICILKNLDCNGGVSTDHGQYEGTYDVIVELTVVARNLGC
ncbi:hypothetical protein PIB30_079790 [Stylosanthes scabra]|uniref:Uncharacterized protein n=1 Tax=Stylosanthes scabra TaxID=79078 RepID=A0ABU6QQV4_9FABA|nr:hypothetical protein [Stylosanthes scabra]